MAPGYHIDYGVFWSPPGTRMCAVVYQSFHNGLDIAYAL